MVLAQSWDWGRINSQEGLRNIELRNIRLGEALNAAQQINAMSKEEYGKKEEKMILLAKSKGWKYQPKYIRNSMCVSCENILRTKEEIMRGYHLTCFLRV